MPNEYPPPPLFDDSAASLAAEVLRFITEREAQIREVVDTVDLKDATFDNVLLPIIDMEHKHIPLLGKVRLYVKAAPDQDLRKAAEDAKVELFKANVSKFQEKGLFELISSVRTRQELLNLDDEDQRLLETTYQTYVNTGIELDEGPRNNLRKIKGEQKRIAKQFEKNIADDKGEIPFNKQMLDGIPSHTLRQILEDLNVKDEDTGNFMLTHKNNHRLPVLKFAQDPLARREMYERSQKAAPGNVSLFKEMLRLRLQAAAILGKSNHVEVVLWDHVLPNATKVTSFLDNLTNALKPGIEIEARNLRELKKKSPGISRDDKFRRWDYPYYKRVMQEESYSVNPKLSEFFPLDYVLERMLVKFGEMFGLDFKEIKGPDRDDFAPSGKAHALVWDPEVRLFIVKNDESNGGDFLGYLYFDLYPRDGKYRHGIDINVQGGFQRSDTTSKRGYAVSALLMDFPKSTDTKPSLLQQDQLRILFHETGHAVHNLVSRTKYHHEVADDFIEVPSQMLEYWCWNSEFLRFVSQHFTAADPKYKSGYGEQVPPPEIPEAYISSLIKSKVANTALELGRQVHWAKFDMLVHSLNSEAELDALSLKKTFNENFYKFQPFDGAEADPEAKWKSDDEKWEWGHEFAIYTHLVNGDGEYYKYAYGLMLAADLFHTKFEADPMNSKTSMDFRKKVLAHGGSKDPLDLMSDFLGREPNDTAFYKELEKASKEQEREMFEN